MLDKIPCTYLFQITNDMANYDEQNSLINIFCRYCDEYVFKFNVFISPTLQPVNVYLLWFLSTVPKIVCLKNTVQASR